MIATRTLLSRHGSIVPLQLATTQSPLRAADSRLIAHAFGTIQQYHPTNSIRSDIFTAVVNPSHNNNSRNKKCSVRSHDLHIRHFSSTNNNNTPPNEEKQSSSSTFEQQLAKKSFLTRRINAILTRSKLVPDPDLRLLLSQGVTFLAYGISLTALVGTMGVDTSPLLASVGGFSITLGLALKDGASQVLSGVSLVLQKPFRTGDIIRLNVGGKDWHGKVLGIDTHFVKLELIPLEEGKTVTGYVNIPSSKVHGTPIVIENRYP